MKLSIHTTRRRVAALLGLLTLVSATHAGAPMPKTQAPGYYRMMLGAFEITALYDGVLDLQPAKLLTNTTAPRVGLLLKQSFEGPVVPTSVNAYLVNTGGKLILIDTGTGSSGIFGPTLGHVIENMKASGYQPEQVDEVYVTHLHPDHVGGLAIASNPAFPNAVVRIDKRDSDFWLNPSNAEKASEDTRSFFPFAMASLKPYIAAGMLKPFEGSAELASGMRAISAKGHTPGHTIFSAQSAGQKIVFWGDTMHVAAVQMPHPEVTIVFDVDSPAAAATRRKAFEDAASEGYLVASAHLPFPGIGHMRRVGKGFHFQPVAYSPVR